jgi:hypothetical protein
MYVNAKGMAGYRGMGDPMMGPPADPSVPVPDQTANQIAILWDQVFGEHRAETSVPAVQTQWVKGIPNWMVGTFGGVFAFTLLVKAMK